MKEIELLRIEAPIVDIGAKQLAVEPSADPDLGFRMWGGKDSHGNVTKFLAKNKSASVSSLKITDMQTGESHIIKVDAGGNLVIASLEVSDIPSHGSSHAYGGNDSVTIDTEQISNMSELAKTFVTADSASAAREIIGAEVDSVTLENGAASDKLPITEVEQSHVSILQQIRNFIRWLYDNRLQLGEGYATAHRGDHGKVAYDHAITGPANPHNTTAAMVGAAPSTATLTDSASSTTLPTAGTATDLRTLLQQTRDCLRGIIGDFVSKRTASLQTVVSGVLFKGGIFLERSSNTFNSIESKMAGDTYNRFEMRSNGAMFWGDGTTSIFESLFRPALGILRTNSNLQALSLDKKDGTDTTPLAGNVQTQINGLVSKSASAILNSGTVGYWGKIFEITGMWASYNRGEFTISWKVYNGDFFQGELQIDVSGSDASPLIYLRQLSYLSTVLFTAVRNGTTWEIWAKQVNISYNIMHLQVVYSATSLSSITGFIATATAASISGTAATVYRYMTQIQSDSSLALVPAAPTQITSSQTVIPVNGQCFAINSTAAVDLILSSSAVINTICYVYSTRATNQNDAVHTVTTANPSGATQTWRVGIGGYTQAAAQSGLMCIKMTSGWMIIGGYGNS